LQKTQIRDRLLAYRIARGWTQAQTAEKAGVSPTTIAHIETGANDNPRRITLMRLAHAFGVSLEEFLGEAPAGQADLFRAAAQADRDAKEAEAAGARMVALSDEGNVRLLEQVREGDAEGIEAEASRLEVMYRRALRLHGADGEFTVGLADALATVLAALALARGGALEDVKAAILRALAAHEQAHAGVGGDRT
jgi:transcriptional regulator with XRE-family HTH domain